MCKTQTTDSIIHGTHILFLAMKKKPNPIRIVTEDKMPAFVAAIIPSFFSLLMKSVRLP